MHRILQKHLLHSCTTLLHQPQYTPTHTPHSYNNQSFCETAGQLTFQSGLLHSVHLLLLHRLQLCVQPELEVLLMTGIHLSNVLLQSLLLTQRGLPPGVQPLNVAAWRCEHTCGGEATAWVTKHDPHSLRKKKKSKTEVDCQHSGEKKKD